MDTEIELVQIINSVFNRFFQTEFDSKKIGIIVNAFQDITSILSATDHLSTDIAAEKVSGSTRIRTGNILFHQLII